jgi:phosphate starvation-inducible protein PhoH
MNNQDAPKTVENILRMFRQYSSGGVMSDTPHSMSLDEAVVAINALRREDMEAVIGEDVRVPHGPKSAGKTYAALGNQLRAEQRKKMEERLNPERTKYPLKEEHE